MSYYTKHVFFCLNQREAPKQCCAQSGSKELFDYAKTQIKTKKLDKTLGIRINMSGCLGRCQEGPVVVIYPEEIWYHVTSLHDIDEIIQEHLIQNRIVERLRI